MMKTVKLLINSPMHDANMIYASGYYCLDPFVLIDSGEQKVGWLPSTELEKAKKKSCITDFYNLLDELNKLHQAKNYPLLKSSLAVEWLKNNNIQEAEVSETFPVIEADNLRKYGIQLKVVQEPFYKERVTKKPQEIELLRENSRLNVEVMDEVKNLIGAASVDQNRQLNYQGQVLTSEYVQSFILKSFLERNLVADSVIVAVGNQGCDPHEHGSGPLYANTSIIVDIFPRNRQNYYHADMTRTFCKGKASDELKSIYATVLEAQKLGLEQIIANKDGKEIHTMIMEYFEKCGYKTGLINGVLQGYFHGTGHGLGLDCHEAPGISKNSSILEENTIVSVEPGLYYLDKGAVRIEDLVLVTKNGHENLTPYEKVLEVE